MNTYDMINKSGVYYTETGFWNKVGLRNIGETLLQKVFELYYVLKKENIPAWAKSAIIGALGYFILPIDLVPDLLPGVGYTDDLAVLAAALATVSVYVDETVRNKAREKVRQLLG